MSGSQGVIRVGVAGWDYPDWNGIVYPARSARSFDRLAFLARFVDVIEINSSFYRPVDPAAARSWVRRVEKHAGFRFTAKAHRSLTHDPSAEPAEIVAQTLRGLAPLREAGLLGVLLVQFPQSFHRDPAALERLERLLPHLRGWPVTVEVRHASWDDATAADWFEERNVGWCVVDQPRVSSTVGPRPRVTSSIGYLRLHGRNAADWFRKDAGRDARYDYLYSLDDLRPLADLASDLSRRTAEVFVVQNNHFRGKALVNALGMKHLLGRKHPRAPASLLSAYPALQAIAVEEPDPGRLF